MQPDIVARPPHIPVAVPCSLVRRPSLAVGDAGSGGVGGPARVPVHLLHRNKRDVAAVVGEVSTRGTDRSTDSAKNRTISRRSPVEYFKQTRAYDSVVVAKGTQKEKVNRKGHLTVFCESQTGGGAYKIQVLKN